MTQAKVVSTFTVDDNDKSPDARMVRLTAKFRREHGLDDSHANMHASSIAVLKQNPKLAEEYFAQPANLARFGADYYSKSRGDE